MRKTLGANRNKLIAQFLGQSVLFSFLSPILALIFIEIVLPSFNTLAERRLALDMLQPTWMMVWFIGFALGVGLLAGIYPALFLSSFRTIDVFKGGTGIGPSRSRFRSALVVIQFSISIALIIGTMTIYHQLNFMRHKNLGFDKECVVVIPRLTSQMRQSLDTIKEELKHLAGVRDVAASTMVPGRGYRLSVVYPEGFADGQPQTTTILNVDADYIPTMRMELIAGRNFSDQISTDAAQSIIINETAARQFGWHDPMGKTIRSSAFTDSGIVELQRTVIGVIRDFHQTSLHRKIDLGLIGNIPTEFGSLSIRIAAQDVAGTLDRLREKWTTIDPDRPFDFYFLDESIDRRYRAEERLGQLALIFSLLAIFIGCLGLFGMSAYAAEQRTKEIGIRKVLGASVTGIVRLLSMKFLTLVAIANLIAWPVAYYTMHHWLQNFAYRISLNLWIFFLSGAAALLVALLTVSYQATKAATADPAKSLRYE